jgi:hypothetical protein
MRRTTRRSKVEGNTIANRDNKTSDFLEDGQGTLWLRKQICVPYRMHIKESILREAHDSTYSIHPGSTKMWKDLKTRY